MGTSAPEGSAAKSRRRRRIVTAAVLVPAGAVLALLAYGLTTGPRHLPTPFASPAQAADPFGELALIRASRPTPAAGFTVPSLTSQPLRLGDFQGRVVFLNFWATWCPPCKEEMPSMERLYRRYKDRGFTILAISIDAAGADRVAAFVKEHGLTFPVGLDPKLAVANQYAIRGLPASFLIDKAGNIAAVAVGPRDWDGAPARAVVETLLK